MCTFLTVFLACPVGVWAAEQWDRIWCAGVALYSLLRAFFCVAVMPLVKGEWWGASARYWLHSGSFL